MEDVPFPERRHLCHDVPSWVPEGAEFFITVNCATRNHDQLTQVTVATALLEAACFYHDQRRWHIQYLLLMPDHWHALMGFPRSSDMATTLAQWKRYTARTLGIGWQDGFFDHRLRNAREAMAKEHYIRHNPVRKNLCQTPEEWPFQMRWSCKGLIVGPG
jgi:putative transposase